MPDNVGYDLKHVQFTLRSRLDKAMRGRGTTIAQYAALEAIDAAGRLSGAELARRCFVTAQTMNNILGNLEQKGLIERRPHAVHGRIIEACLSPSGVRLLDECRQTVASIEDAMLQRLTTGERTELDRLLLLCLDGLED